MTLLKCHGFRFNLWKYGVRYLSGLKERPCLLKEENNITGSFTVTDSCVNRFKSVQLKKLQAKAVDSSSTGSDDIVLRINVTAGGCQGFNYSFCFENARDISAEDLWLKKDDALIVLQKKAFRLLKGSVIDYHSELKGSAFVIKSNPNSDHSCSCGSSFSVKTANLMKS
ncbi:hypothetical protein XU18_0376 [Perkinsela sp. CCAP 1560/4]|nr:hypothetical protein XU18_0376 [Perkinsela sp. CCAP 1560/4]|eukprot:KNH09691.1 hypothetical protein XU18_0376 [Perkinsela sp. CCAP 1560/4]